MSKAQNNDNSDVITYRTGVKFPIGLIAGVVAGFALFLYAEQQTDRHDNATNLANVYTVIEAKTALRYTNVEARQYQESVKQRLLDIEKRNTEVHISLQRQLDTHSHKGK